MNRLNFLMYIPGLRSLAGRLSWLIIGVLLLTQLVAFFFYFSESEAQYYELQGDERIRRMVAVMNAVEGKHMRHQDAILDSASDAEFVLFIDDLVLPPSTPQQPELSQQLTKLRELTQREAHIILLRDLMQSNNPEHQLLLDDMGEGAEELVLAGLPLRDGSWLYGTLYDRHDVLLAELGDELLYSIPVFLLVVGVIVFSVRRLTRPLSLLADKAVRFGRGEAFQPLPLKGTEEVRCATGAFNDMAQRLERHVADRQQLLAAISHDLRSPLTGMRIQAEFIADEQVRDSMIAGVEEMQQMISSVLDFARDDAAAEQVVTVDVEQLLQALIQQYQVQQHAVNLARKIHPSPPKHRFNKRSVRKEGGSQQNQVVAGSASPFSKGGTRGILGLATSSRRVEGTKLTNAAENYSIKTRPLALKRVLRNLLENALKYGQRAEVTLFVESDWLLITIEDEGPGIAEADLERVFEPFTQLDDSRPAARSGVGMGLSVARSLLRALGGDIKLMDRRGAQSGLRATIQLPR